MIYRKNTQAFKRSVVFRQHLVALRFGLHLAKARILFFSCEFNPAGCNPTTNNAQQTTNQKTTNQKNDKQQTTNNKQQTTNNTCKQPNKQPTNTTNNNTATNTTHNKPNNPPLFGISFWETLVGLHANVQGSARISFQLEPLSHKDWTRNNRQSEVPIPK